MRSSGTTEDAGDSSFAGMNASFTNVIGLPDVLARVKDCWASLYGERVLAYRAEQQLTEEPAIAVIIQKMIFSEVSGVMFTADPTTGALDRMIIESVFGQGEAIVSGRVEPDTYILDKVGPRLLSVRQGKQKFKIVRGPDGADVEQPLDAGEVDRRSLSQAEIIAIAELGLRAERHYGTPQDLEWARAAGATYLVQSRPITTLRRSGGIRAATDGFGYPDSLTLWLGGICRARVRAGTNPHLPQPAARVPRRRSPGRRDDKSGLGAGNAPRDRVDHRRGRRDLSRGDRLPRASAALRSRHRATPLRACAPAKKSPSTVEPARFTPVRPLRSPFKGRPNRFRNLFRHWRPGCMSIWPLPSTPRKSLRCRWTVSACSEPNSWWPMR